MLLAAYYAGITGWSLILDARATTRKNSNSKISEISNILRVVYDKNLKFTKVMEI